MTELYQCSDTEAPPSYLPAGSVSPKKGEVVSEPAVNLMES